MDVIQYNKAILEKAGFDNADKWNQGLEEGDPYALPSSCFRSCTISSSFVLIIHSFAILDIQG